MSESESQLGLLLLVARRLKWPAIFTCYLVFVMLFKVAGFFVLICIMGGAVYVFFLDKQREATGADDFAGDRLFFRYGEVIQEVFFPIPVKAEWQSEQTVAFAGALRQDVAAGLVERLRGGAAEVDETLTVLDTGTQRSKDFLRLRARTPAGCMLTHFVHFAAFGNTVAAQYITYVRGRYTDWDILKFALASPFSVWWWGIPWLLNRFSLCVMVSHFTDSAFDITDLQTIFTATKELVMSSTEQALKKHDLLTEAVTQLIQHISYGPTQKIRVSHSSEVSFGNVVQSPGPARS